jgi:hypothetical protein
LAGVERVYGFATVEGLDQAHDEILGVPGYVFVVLDVEPLTVADETAYGRG